ncbi:PAS domain-containing protein [Sedimenticola selenatireducens]|uniref:histidine kinase n=1 Tax=Sedimenticola selenatireducens TaxID=191960 RepID=A0A557SH38_9GAMM|nr:PAS domain-containing protein [Sedimenticola selenatireducens]TVO76723.1 PAS domain S-box protein [Sedimenticola selenatireducens]TVT64166.1 MAG: PAS domain S-box protein [Sedimenticola selenatireducens]
MSDESYTDWELAARESGLHLVLVLLLQIQLANRSLRDCLKDALVITLTSPFSALLPSGAIFLANQQTQELELLVERNLDEPLKALCHRVPYGHCLCGRAVVEGEIIHAAHIDDRHETVFDGIKPHGHYNVPLMSGKQVLGVMVLYLPDGHQRDEREVRFLEAAALVMAGIIERKRFEEQQETHYQSLIENLPQRLFYKDAESRYVSCNRLYAKDLGIQTGDISGRVDTDFYPQEEAERFVREDQHVMQTGQILEQDTTRIIQGVESSYHRLKAPLRDSAGAVIGVFGMYWDNSQEKRSQAALKESEEKFSAMANSAQDAIVMVNQHEEVVFWNMASESMFGFQVEDIVGQRLDDWIEPGASRDEFARLVAQLTTSGRDRSAGKTIELTALRKGREPFPIELSISALQLKGQWHVIGIMRDISERKQAEQEQKLMEVQLRQAQKLESIGQLAAGISHEINTPTQFVGDNTQFFKEAVGDLESLIDVYQQLIHGVESGADLTPIIAQVKDKEEEIDLAFLREELPRAVDQSLEGVERIAKIVSAMKEFSHPGAVDKVEMDINRALQTTLEVSRNEWKYVAEIKLDLADDLPKVLCVPDQINQVFLNLIVNAAHAIGDALKKSDAQMGVIGISTRRQEDFIEVRVSDSGTGVPEEIKGRIFDPFFTTKVVGKGTGQGLCIAYTTVVERHGGNLQVEDNPEGGAVFVVTLPLEQNTTDASIGSAVLSVEQDG